MADEGAFEFDRIVDLNKSVDEALLQEAMRALSVDTRTEAINRSLRIAIESSRTSEG
jgi:Arc/MetJ family transcription regulator